MTDEQAKRPGEVINIYGGRVILNDRGVNEAAVETAEWLLKATLAGEITGIAAAYVYADSGSGWQTGGNTGGASVLGSLTRMTARLAQD